MQAAYATQTKKTRSWRSWRNGCLHNYPWPPLLFGRLLLQLNSAPRNKTNSNHLLRLKQIDKINRNLHCIKNKHQQFNINYKQSNKCQNDGRLPHRSATSVASRTLRWLRVVETPLNTVKPRALQCTVQGSVFRTASSCFFLFLIMHKFSELSNEVLVKTDNVHILEANKNVEIKTRQMSLDWRLSRRAVC